MNRTGAQERYPRYTVLVAMTLTLLIIIFGSFIINNVWGEHTFSVEPRYPAFPAVCYWAGDTRTLTRISLYGYSDYHYDLSDRHLTHLPNRSWWPVFPLIASWMIDLTGDGVCSGWWVNVIAIVLLIPVIQAITQTRRLGLLVGLTIVPYAMWLYVGMAEGVFLLFSGLLWLLCLQARTGARWRNMTVGGGALVLGALVGLTKPNSLALMPCFLALGLLESRRYLQGIKRDSLLPWQHRLKHLINDGNPGWAGILATMGIALGNGLWFYQTSGFYPFYVLLAQRTLWFKAFQAGDLASLLDYFAGGVQQVLEGTADLRGLERLMRLTAPLIIGIVTLQGLRPRWPGSEPRPVPAYARFSPLAILALLFLSGQIHAITRYTAGNIFFVILYLRYVYGAEDEPPLWRLPWIVLRGQPGAFAAVLRLVVFAFGPSLTWIVLQLSPQLGI